MTAEAIHAILELERDRVRVARSLADEIKTSKGYRDEIERLKVQIREYARELEVRTQERNDARDGCESYASGLVTEGEDVEEHCPHWIELDVFCEKHGLTP